MPETEEQPQRTEKCCAVRSVRKIQVVLLIGCITMDVILQVDLSVGIVAMASNSNANPNIKDYGWSLSQTSTILSSFYWGYTVMRWPMVWLSGRYGIKNFLAVALFLSGALTAFTELAADVGGVVLMCALRVLLGMVLGFISPSTNTYLAKWFPPDDLNFMEFLVQAGAPLGTITAMALSGVLAKSAAGWPSIFYTFGGLSVFWGILVFFLGADKPASHKYITREEQSYIEDCLNRVSDEGVMIARPWRSILSSKPVIALAVVQCGHHWGFYTLLTEMPTYFNNVLGFDIQSDGLLSALPYLVMSCISFIFTLMRGLIYCWMRITNGTYMKLFNSVGHWGPGLTLLILSFTGLEIPAAAVTLLSLTVGLTSVTMFGFRINSDQLSSNFSVVLRGMTTSVADITSIAAPLVVGAVVKNNAPEEWRTVFLIAAGFYFIGNLIFIIFGSDKVQPWDGPIGLPTESEGVTDDVISSAFRSDGDGCSCGRSSAGGSTVVVVDRGGTSSGGGSGGGGGGASEGVVGDGIFSSVSDYFVSGSGVFNSNVLVGDGSDVFPDGSMLYEALDLTEEMFREDDVNKGIPSGEPFSGVVVDEETSESNPPSLSVSSLVSSDTSSLNTNSSVDSMNSNNDDVSNDNSDSFDDGMATAIALTLAMATTTASMMATATVIASTMAMATAIASTMPMATGKSNSFDDGNDDISKNDVSHAMGTSPARVASHVSYASDDSDVSDVIDLSDFSDYSC